MASQDETVRLKLQVDDTEAKRANQTLGQTEAELVSTGEAADRMAARVKAAAESWEALAGAAARANQSTGAQPRDAKGRYASYGGQSAAAFASAMESLDDESVQLADATGTARQAMTNFQAALDSVVVSTAKLRDTEEQEWAALVKEGQARTAAAVAARQLADAETAGAEAARKMLAEEAQAAQTAQRAAMTFDELQAEIRRVRDEQKQLTAAFRQGEITAGDYAREASRLQGQLASYNQVVSTSSAGMKGLGQGILQVGYIVDDAQYLFQDFAMGIRSVGNNIPGLVLGLGGSAGLAGAIGIVAVGAGLLASKWETISGLWSKDTSAPATDGLIRLNEQIDSLNKKKVKLLVDVRALDEAKDKLDSLKAGLDAYDKAVAARTSAQQESGRSVEKALIEETGGGDAYEALYADVAGTFKEEAEKAHQERVAELQKTIAHSVNLPVGTDAHVAAQASAAASRAIEELDRLRKDEANREHDQRQKAKSDAGNLFAAAFSGDLGAQRELAVRLNGSGNLVASGLVQTNDVTAVTKRRAEKAAKEAKEKADKEKEKADKEKEKADKEQLESDQKKAAEHQALVGPGRADFARVTQANKDAASREKAEKDFADARNKAEIDAILQSNPDLMAMAGGALAEGGNTVEAMGQVSAVLSRILLQRGLVPDEVTAATHGGRIVGQAQRENTERFEAARGAGAGPVTAAQEVLRQRQEELRDANTKAFGVIAQTMQIQGETLGAEIMARRQVASQVELLKRNALRMRGMARPTARNRGH